MFWLRNEVGFGLEQLAEQLAGIAFLPCAWNTVGIMIVSAR